MELNKLSHKSRKKVSLLLTIGIVILSVINLCFNFEWIYVAVGIIFGMDLLKYKRQKNS